MPTNKNVIIIEDNETFSLLVTHYMKNNLGDVNVFVENSGRKAIESIHRLRPSIVILDYFLEDDLSGQDVMNAIDKMPDRPDVILLSSLKDEKEKQEIMARGVHAFIPKSNESIYDLVKTVQELLEKKSEEETQKNKAASLFGKPFLLIAAIVALIIVIALIAYFK